LTLDVDVNRRASSTASSTLSLDALVLLVEILDAGNLSGAARRLKMTRANVSYHLKQLERSVGVQVVRRTTRRIEPTEVGRRLYQRGRRIREELAAAQDAVTTLGRTPKGRVRLSVPTGYGQMVMTPWLLEFKRLHPGIVLEVVFENRVVNLLRDEVDIAVRVVSKPPAALVARDLGPVRYVACASRSYALERGMPARLEDLRDVPLIASPVVGRHLRIGGAHKGVRHEVSLSPSLASENFSFLRDAVLAGLGVGLVPDYVVRDAVSQGLVVTSLDDWDLSIFGTRMYIMYMPNRHHTRAASTFLEFILGRARAGQGARTSADGRDA
jgi:DNA-binding transcriptional LysR family regulator